MSLGPCSLLFSERWTGSLLLPLGLCSSWSTVIPQLSLGEGGHARGENIWESTFISSGMMGLCSLSSGTGGGPLLVTSCSCPGSRTQLCGASAGRRGLEEGKLSWEVVTVGVLTGALHPAALSLLVLLRLLVNLCEDGAVDHPA